MLQRDIAHKNSIGAFYTDLKRDLLGYVVLDRDGKKVGFVSDVYFNRADRKARYIIISTLRSDSHTFDFIYPVAACKIESDYRIRVSDKIATLRTYGVYQPDHVLAYEEDELMNYTERICLDGSDFYGQQVA